MAAHKSQHGLDSRLDVTVDIFEEQGRVIARWPQMKLSSHGQTRKEAVDNLINMVIAALLAGIERHDLAAMLRNAGVEILPVLPGQRAPDLDEIVTLPYLVVKEHDDPRAAA